MSTIDKNPWKMILFDEIIEDSAFGPRFSGDAYSESGNIATLRTTDISKDGWISYDSMPMAQLSESTFAKHLLKKGDLVITRSGRVGTTAIFSGHSLPVLPGAFLIRFRLTKTAVPLFYRYWFNSQFGQKRLLSVARGAAQQNINITNVKTLSVPLPPTSTQIKICSILSPYDYLIENNRRRIQLLEESVRLLYKEWFVHLRFPGHEHVKIVDGVPEGWEKKPIKQICLLNYGKALKAEHRLSGEFPVYGSSGAVGWHNKSLVNARSIIIGRKGNVGSVFWASKDFWPIDTVYFITPEESSLYLYHTLQNVSFINTDVAVPGLNRNMAYSREILIPTDNILTLFHKEVEPVQTQIEKLTEFVEKLAEARDLLLPRLMNGILAV